jgi:predicted nucleic acid-binding protein
MTLADTSVWVDHLRHGRHRFADLLEEGRVLCHPFVVGELACGSLANRDGFLRLLGALPRATVAEHEEVMRLVQARGIHGRGLGWVDVHLLASTLLDGCALWTLDKRLEEVATQLGVTAR